MKTLKRFVPLVLGLIFVFSMTACTKKRTAQEILESSIKKSESIKSSHTTGSAKVKINSDSASSMDFTMTFDTKVTDLNKDSMQVESGMKLAILGQSMDITSYYTDGYYYTKMGTEKQKLKMDLKSIQEQIENTIGQTSLPAKYYEDLSLEEADGNQVLSYKLNEEGLNEYVTQIMSQMNSITGQSNTDAANSIKVSSFSGTMTIDENDNILSQTVKLTMKSTTEENASIQITMNSKQEATGKDVKLSLPDDLSSYTEISTETTTAAQ